MPRHHKTLSRLFVEFDLAPGQSVKLDKPQTNYLLNVMRKKEGDALILFNGRDGAFYCEISDAHRKGASIEIVELAAEQTPKSDLWYFFAPLKSARLDYMVQKATEMGAGHLQPVITQHTQVNRIKLDKMQANAIEASEQCEILNVPQVHEEISLQKLLDEWDEMHGDRRLVFADEEAPSGSARDDLMNIKDFPVGLIIGPEGGFSTDEREMLRSKPYCVPISLGPRILRADTAAVAGLTIIQSIIGDLR
jgi:16S rRNA (uracil1498-N3)-methyltransferase